MMVGDNRTITYIVDTEERRDKWIEAFHTLINRKIEKYKEKYVTGEIISYHVKHNKFGDIFLLKFKLLKDFNSSCKKFFLY